MYRLAFHRSKLCNSALCRQQSIFFFFLKHLLASLQCPCCKLPHSVFVLQLTECLNYVSIHIRARGVLVDAVCDFHPGLEDRNGFCECV